MRLAATVMLVRPVRASFEIFMLRRSEQSHFVPHAYVFPGGTLSESDLSERARARLRVDSQAIARQFRARPAPGLSPVPLPSSREAAGLLFAALRELFEEAGVLFACDAHGTSPRDTPQSRANFLELLETRDLYADARALTFFSQWLTPPQFPKRYNTHFFLARASADAVAVADTYETHDGLWISPADALMRNTAGELHLVYPTIKHLQRLLQFTDSSELFEFARAKPILAVTPNTVENGFALPPELEEAW